MADEPTTTPAADEAVAGPQPVTVSDEAPSPAAAPGKPLEKGGQGKATVRTRYPSDRFDHNVKGVDAITAEGVEVDRSKVSALLTAADEAGVELEEVDDDA